HLDTDVSAQCGGPIAQLSRFAFLSPSPRPFLSPSPRRQPGEQESSLTHCASLLFRVGANDPDARDIGVALSAERSSPMPVAPSRYPAFFMHLARALHAP